MKNSILKISLLFFLSFLVLSCTNESKEELYACPMNCEGEKTYAKVENCPVCGMDLKPIEGTVDDVREFSNVLAVKYKQTSPMDFSHSNIISVFDKGGVLYHQQEGLNVDNKTTVAKITELTK